MSGDQDNASDDSKTEEPTPERVRKALEEGNSPRYRELSLAVAFLAATGAAFWWPGGGARTLDGALEQGLAMAGRARFENVADLVSAVSREARATLLVAGVFVAMLMVGPIAVSVVVGHAAPRLSRLKPDLSRVSIRTGFSRLARTRGGMSSLVSFLKILAIVVVMLSLAQLEWPAIRSALLQDSSALPGEVTRLSTRILELATLVAVLIGGVDVVVARSSWRRSLRMSKHDVKMELKEAEGDPLVKARFRALLTARSRRRSLDNVSRATVVITNPTHFAVALRYDPTEAPAPIVLAKGKNWQALRIRERAEAFKVPIVENKPLARSLYRMAPVDSLIPPELYKAVAAILHALARPKRPPARPPTDPARPLRPPPGAP